MARSYDGNDYLSAAFAPSLTTDDVLSMVVWFKSDVAVSSADVMTLNENGANGEAFRLRIAQPTAAGNEVTATSRTSSTEQSATTTNEWSVSTWHHAAGVWNGTASRTAYLDGDAANKGTDTTTQDVDGSALGRTTLGAFYGTSQFNLLSGDLAHAAIYDGALTDDDVAALAAGMSPLKVRPEILLHYWPLSGYSAEIDLVGGQDLTVTGATDVSDDSRIVLPRKRFFGLPTDNDVAKAPNAGTLTLTGESPGVTFKLNAPVTAGALVLTGESPTLKSERDFSLTAGGLTLTGESPAVAFDLSAAPTAGTLTFTGESPSVAFVRGVTPSAGSLALTGESPAVAFKLNVAPDAASLSLTGEEISALVGGLINVDAGSLSLTGAATAITFSLGFSPTAGAATLTGEDPGVTFKRNVAPTAGSLVLEGQSPAVALRLNAEPAAAALTLTGEAPDVALKANQSVTVGGLTLSGDVLALTFKRAVAVTAGSLTVTGISPDVALSVGATVTAGSLSVTGESVTVLATPEVLIGGRVNIEQQDRTVAIAS